MKKLVSEKLPEINPFIRLQAEALDWTGYNPETIAKAVNIGISLSTENKTLLEENRSLKSRDRPKEIENFFGGVGIVVGIGIIILMFTGLFLLVGKDNAVRRAENSSLSQGVELSLTYAEAMRRKVHIEQIQIQLPDNSLFLRNQWERDFYSEFARTHSNTPSWEEVDKAYETALNEAISKGTLYSVFIKE